MKTITDARKAIETLTPFIGTSQLTVLRQNCYREEKQFFIDLLCTYADRVTNMPKVYEQDGKGDQAVVHLHYFIGSCDWHITERDTTTEQYQAFGRADLGYGPELGYISIAEIVENGGELDLYFTPITLAELDKKNEHTHH